MALKRYLYFMTLLSLLTGTPAFAQETRSQSLGGSEPFSISMGSSFTASSSGQRSTSKISKQQITSDFEEALEIIRIGHVNGSRLDSGELTASAIGTMLKTLDPHSNYHDAGEFQNLLGEHQSEYSGTGSSIAGFERNGTLDTYIVSTFPGSSAAGANLRYGDRIIAVNGQNVSGRTPDVVRDLVRGKRGTFVRMTVERADTLAVETVELKRDRVHQPAVPAGYLLKEGVGYIDLTAGFSNSTFAELDTALAGLHRQGMRSLVMDLRGNGGGILDQAVKVAERFLPPGSAIVSQKGRYASDHRKWTAGKARFETMPMVLLVDENTASASEVLAGAFQDNDRALIVGEKTFGKGLVQNVLALPSGSGLTLTAARYYTPSGRSIQRDYADVGLYDYFNHRNATAEIERSVYVARTITNRVVYGGDGITPDQNSKSAKLNAAQMSLLNPLFFFARDIANGRAETSNMSGLTVNQQLRQQIVSGDETDNEDLVERFANYCRKSGSWKTGPEVFNRERAFINEMLRYNVALAVFGTDSANRTKIESDPQVKQAYAALPKAATLALAAQRVRSGSKKEKGSLSLILSEQR